MDRAVRRSGFAKWLAQDEIRLSDSARHYLQSYTDGINAYLSSHARPWPFWLVGYSPTPWTIRDSLLVGKLIGWVGLASLQADTEKLILEFIRLGDEGTALATAMYAPYLASVDTSLLSIIRSLNISRSWFPEKPRNLLPNSVASNNWALDHTRTLRGQAILASDPHLPIDRLPAFWYEIVMHLPNDFRMGVTLPGFPGLWMGRTRNLAFGFTYGCADLVDHFIEDVQDEKYLRDGQWEDLEKEVIVLYPKGSAPVNFTQYATVHGMLETDGDSLVGSGRHYRLATAYTSLYRSSLSDAYHSSVDALLRFPQSATVAEAQRVFQTYNIEVSANFLFADSAGGIAYQQTGWIPIRARDQNGVLPIRGCNSSFDWQGIHSGHLLSSSAGISSLATANDDVQSKAEGAPLTVNFHLGSDRVDRIKELLNGRQKHSIADMQVMQSDLVSNHAKRYLVLLRPHLNLSDPYEALLANWDHAYSADSKAAALFESFYERLIVEVLGRVLGSPRAIALAESPMLLIYTSFDRLIFSYAPELDPYIWLNQSREQFLLSVLRNTTRGLQLDALLPLSDVRRVVMKNLFFGGKLPLAQLLGIDRETTVLGSRGSIVQGRVKSGIHPPGAGSGGISYRLITDFAEATSMLTALPGGPSDDPLSVFYCNDVSRWERFEYKRLDASFLEPN